MVIGPFLAFAIGWLIFPAPTEDDLATTQVATIDYANGQHLATIRPEGVQNRVKVRLSQVPPPVRYAVLAAEDRGFYSNPGFDLTGIARAVWNQLTGGDGGGSTITQQYIKNATGRDQHTLLRKYREIITAVKISQEYDKQRILDGYLNTIYFGRGAYGIQAAAKAYFGVNCEQLTLTQGALLAGVIQAPSDGTRPQIPTWPARGGTTCSTACAPKVGSPPHSATSRAFPRPWRRCLLKAASPATTLVTSIRRSRPNWRVWASASRT